METKTKPAHEIREGAIKASIWANQTPKGVWHKVTVRRLYTVPGERAEGKSKWKSSDSFSSADLPLVTHVLQLAGEWMREHEAKSA